MPCRICKIKGHNSRTHRRYLWKIKKLKINIHNHIYVYPENHHEDHHEDNNKDNNEHHHEHNNEDNNEDKNEHHHEDNNEDNNEHHHEDNNEDNNEEQPGEQAEQHNVVNTEIESEVNYKNIPYAIIVCLLINIIKYMAIVGYKT